MKRSRKITPHVRPPSALLAGLLLVAAVATLGLRGAPADAPAAGERYALLVGIDDYPGSQNDLPSSVADAEVMKETLIEEYGFREENVLLLTDEDATRENIIGGMRTHLGQATVQDAAVFYYSGHGVQMERGAGEKAPFGEGDGVDEAIYVWGHDRESSIILDDEIGALADYLFTDRVLVVLDACHSGTGTRAMDESELPIKEVDYRDVAGTLSLPTTYVTGGEADGNAEGDAVEKGNAAKGNAARGEAAARSGAAGRAGEPAGHVLLSAAAADEYALAGDGSWSTEGGAPAQASVFTYFLVKQMRSAGGEATFEDLMRPVKRASVQYSIDRTGRAQTPQLEGQRRNTRLNAFFEGEK